MAALKRAAIAGGALVVLLSGMIAPADVSARAQHLGVPEHVTPDARAELAARMSRHGATMSNLVRSVVLLDRARIRVLAGRIADEEVVAQTGRSTREHRPLGLPREFSAEQTKLSVAARDLAVAAAEGSDDRVLADRFAAVTAACVTCHSVYLHGRPDQRPFGSKNR